MESLKAQYFMAENESISWEELADIDSLVSDLAIYEAYGHINFTEEDFRG
jgi:hypothetical protein